MLTEEEDGERGHHLNVVALEVLRRASADFECVDPGWSNMPDLLEGHWGRVVSRVQDLIAHLAQEWGLPDPVGHRAAEDDEWTPLFDESYTALSEGGEFDVEDEEE